MTLFTRISLVVSIAALAGGGVYAAEAKPMLAAPGKLLFEDDFSRSEMAPKWRVGKGHWTVADGAATAEEIPEDKHAAYAYLKPPFQFKDVVIEYSAKIDGSRACHLMVNDSKYKESHAGHILRATLMAGKVDLADYKYGLMKNDIFDKIKDPNTTADEKKRLRESVKDMQAVFKVDSDASQWRQIRVEIVGEEMLVSIEGKPVGYLKSAGIDHATKNAIGFEIGGKSASIKNVKVWEAMPVAGWTTERDAVVAGLAK